MSGVGACDAAAAGIASTEWIEVEPRFAGNGQAAATRGAGDGRTLPASDGDRSPEFGIGRVEHGGHLLVERARRDRVGMGRRRA